MLAEARALAEDGRRQGARWPRSRAATGRPSLAHGRYEEARAHFERRLAIAREIGDRQGEASATGNLGIVFWIPRPLRGGAAHYERCLAIAREIGDREGEASATGNLGIVFRDLGRYEEAQAHYERHSRSPARSGTAGRGRRHGNLGNVFWTLGRYEEARAHYERRLAICPRDRGPAGRGHRHGEPGQRAPAPSAATRRPGSTIERRLAISREIGDRRGRGHATGNLGNVLHSPSAATRRRQAHHERRLAIAREIGDRRARPAPLGNLGTCSASPRPLRGGDGAPRAASRDRPRDRGPARARPSPRQSGATSGLDLGQTRSRPGGTASVALAICREIGDSTTARATRSRPWCPRPRGGRRNAGSRPCTRRPWPCAGRSAHGTASPTRWSNWARSTGEPESSTKPAKPSDEAVDLLRQQNRKPELAQALALLANLPGGDADRSRSRPPGSRRSRQHPPDPLLPLEGHRQARAPRRSQAPPRLPRRARPRGVPRVDAEEREAEPRDRERLEGARRRASGTSRRARRGGWGRGRVEGGPRRFRLLCRGPLGSPPSLRSRPTFWGCRIGRRRSSSTQSGPTKTFRLCTRTLKRGYEPSGRSRTHTSRSGAARPSRWSSAGSGEAPQTWTSPMTVAGSTGRLDSGNSGRSKE